MAKEILKDEVLSDEELEKVAGGTVQQCEEIQSAVLNNPALKNVFDSLPKVPGMEGGKLSDDIALEGVLKTVGIDASLNRTHGTMFDNFQNQYKDSATGKNLTHAEVLNILSTIKG